MEFLKLGASEIYINNEYIGNTKKSKDVILTLNTVYEDIVDDTVKTVLDKIVKGRTISFNASIDFNEENYNKFSTGQVINGELKIIGCFNNLAIIIPNSDITIMYNNSYKSTEDMSIDIFSVAVQDINGNDLELLEIVEELIEDDNYTQNEYNYGGELVDQFQLLENYIYLANDSIKYLNTGGDRNWTSGIGTPDELFVPSTFKYLYENFLNKDKTRVEGSFTASGFNTTGGNEPRIIHKTNLASNITRTIRKYYIDSNDVIRATHTLNLNTVDVESYVIDIRDPTGIVTKTLSINRNGVTVDGEYVAFTSETENYTQMGYFYDGLLTEKTSLLEDAVYLADDNIKYLNTGGNRSWIFGTGTPDIDFIPANLKYILDNWITKEGGIIDGELQAKKFITQEGNTIRMEHKNLILTGAVPVTTEEVYTDLLGTQRVNKKLTLDLSNEENYEISLKDNTGTVTKTLNITRNGIYEDNLKLLNRYDVPNYLVYDEVENITVTDLAEVSLHTFSDTLEIALYEFAISTNYSFPDLNDNFFINIYLDGNLYMQSIIEPKDLTNIQHFSSVDFIQVTAEVPHTIEVKAILSAGGNPATVNRSVFYIEMKKRGV